ncbi:hypothetical protein [Endozoicomonas numazuensis]|uniref:Kinase n=1 Tax=Endozoicomonas numazuensis TaxID=1137799 RepID=A0A081NK19_9GAMM|nr:hypothetical protein [Endozoicomonas numazuensis]KEQ18792.1 hypothetical protein GZ78_01515 [Endozoicomonas numazuensis]
MQKDRHKLAHINPDHYLQTEQGRFWTPERSQKAWEQAYSDFEKVLSDQNGNAIVYIVFGVQGGGKTTWINRHKPHLPCVYFDAALPARKHRIRALSVARLHAEYIVAVWIKTPLEHALNHNSQRQVDEMVPEHALRSVYEQLDPPTLSEGFDKIMIIEPGDFPVAQSKDAL